VSFSSKKYFLKKSFAQGYPQANKVKCEYVNNYFFLGLDHLAAPFHIDCRFGNTVRKRVVFTATKDSPQGKSRASTNLLEDFSCRAKYQSRTFREFRKGLTLRANPC
jgi:hypothetical protein